MHGAFADSSSWSGVIASLQANGCAVTAVANPLRGLSADSAYVAEIIREIPGPVIAVAHSYGGAVITNAAAEALNVVGLVFVAAYLPDEGESLGQVSAASRDSVLMSALVPHHYAVANGERQTLEFSINPAKFRDTFAADLSADQSAILAAIQRPIAEPAFSEPTRSAGWKRVPSWAVVASRDLAAGTDLTRSMAQRAGATITELKGSHLIMLSQPKAIAAVILEAVSSVARQPVGAAG